MLVPPTPLVTDLFPKSLLLPFLKNSLIPLRGPLFSCPARTLLVEIVRLLFTLLFLMFLVLFFKEPVPGKHCPLLPRNCVALIIFAKNIISVMILKGFIRYFNPMIPVIILPRPLNLPKSVSSSPNNLFVPSIILSTIRNFAKSAIF